jgi:hypothetical protein
MKFEYKNWFLENPQFPDHRKPNETAMWHLADTKELFEENLKKYPTSSHLLNYQQNPITYEYNNYGFRTSDDFTLDGDGNIFLGCSHTFGIGHYLKNIWSHKLSKMIGGKFYNIAEPGSGIYTQYRYLNYFKDKIKFKNVFHFLPDECWLRYEFINSNNDFILPFHSPDGVKPPLDSEMLDMLYSDKQLHLNNYAYIDAIRSILNNLGVNYYLVTKSLLDIWNINPHHETLIPARDLMHYYVEDHSELADIFYYKYTNKITDNTDNSILLNELDPRKII